LSLISSDVHLPSFPIKQELPKSFKEFDSFDLDDTLFGDLEFGSFEGVADLLPAEGSDGVVPTMTSMEPAESTSNSGSDFSGELVSTVFNQMDCEKAAFSRAFDSIVSSQVKQEPVSAPANMYTSPMTECLGRSTRSGMVQEVQQWDSDNMCRKDRVARYREKRKRRTFQKTIRYQSRKAYAEVRPRIKGRFATKEEVEALKAEEAERLMNGGMKRVSSFSVVPEFMA
jgi:hypothetical protein